MRVNVISEGQRQTLIDIANIAYNLDEESQAKMKKIAISH